MKYIIFEYLKHFSNEEIISFKKFILSPYFNKSKNAVKLFNALIKDFPRLESGSISKNMLYDSADLYKPYKNSTFDSLMNDLALLAEKFLIQNGFDKSKKLKHVVLFDELFQFNNRRLLEKNLRKLNSNKNNSYADSGEDYFIEKYMYESSLYNIMLKYQKLKSERYLKTAENNYKLIYINLIYHFILEISKSYIVNKSQTALKGNNEFISVFYDINILDAITKLKNNNLFKDHKFILDIYYNMINMYEYFDKEEYYESCYKSIYSNEKKINREELNYLYSRLIDYCVLKKNKKYDKKLLEIYDKFLKKSYYMKKNQNFINADLWRNIVIIGYKLNKKDWLEKIISKYTGKINPVYRSGLENYSKSILLFMKKNYEKALENLYKIPVDYFQYKNDFYSFNIMINYELGKYVEIYQVLENFTKYIKSNKHSTTEKVKYTNFVNIVKELSNIKYNQKKYSYNTLSNFINSKPLIHKKWLLKKLEEPKKKNRRNKVSA